MPHVRIANKLRTMIDAMINHITEVIVLDNRIRMAAVVYVAKDTTIQIISGCLVWLLPLC